MNILIIDDETENVQKLSSCISAIIPQTGFIKTAPTFQAAIAVLEETDLQIDLIFSETILDGESAFEGLDRAEVRTPIVFCSQYECRESQGKELIAVDFIPKPFSQSNVKKAIHKFLLLRDFFLSSKALADRDINIGKKLNSILVFKRDKIIPLRLADIAIFELENNSVAAYDLKGNKWNVKKRLNSLEYELYPTFFRVNRQFLINRNVIKSASQHFNRKVKVDIDFNFSDLIIVSKQKVSSFLNWLSLY